MVRESEYKIWSYGRPVKLGLYFVVVSIPIDNFTWHFIPINYYPYIVLLTICLCTLISCVLCVYAHLMSLVCMISIHLIEFIDSIPCYVYSCCFKCELNDK
ncbi:hypothetical protein Scep_021603 [Stephania cephalantha]|uniref:Uncharacterized protein n=1 Tax=Stephania cephalantha TaxID=152367 RepID=A0AAP0I200_9MAGN